MDDNTLRVRIAQSAGRNKLTLVVCAMLVLVGLVGWLTTLS
ncbi:MAG TPA: hypothetical protein VIQ55_14195 [Burkholderiales bacterium]|jgi:hypothetical protein